VVSIKKKTAGPADYQAAQTLGANVLMVNSMHMWKRVCIFQKVYKFPYTTVMKYLTAAASFSFLTSAI